MSENISLIPMERIERAILLIRGEKVLLDSDLARLYEVETRVLNQAVKRNADRTPRASSRALITSSPRFRASPSRNFRKPRNLFTPQGSRETNPV
jgi:hypothetical protein